MKRAPKAINRNQLTGLYWPTWQKAVKVLLANHYGKDDAESLRKEILAKQGVKSSKDLNNRQLDEVLKAHAAISSPRDGKRQADLADQSLKRVRYRIRQAQIKLNYTDANVEGVAQQMYRRPIAQLDEEQLINVSNALETHVLRGNRPKVPKPGSIIYL